MDKPSYNRRLLFSKAWSRAKWHAKHQRVSARKLFADELRQAWVEERKAVAEIIAMRERVQAEVERIRQANTELARRRHEREMDAYRAKCEADMVRALEMSRQLTRNATSRAA
jgi:hypothetical protein